MGVTLQMMAVRAFPPSDARKIWVSLLSRKLTNPSPSLSCLITKLKADRLVLIAQPSRKRSPVALVWEAFSEPARSTMRKKNSLTLNECKKILENNKYHTQVDM